MTSLETLRALGSGDEAPEDAKRRVYGGVMLALGAAAASTVSSVHAHARVAPAPVAASGASVLVGSKLVTAGVGLVLGCALGAATYRAFGPENVRIVYVDRPVPAATRATVAAAPALSAPAAMAPPTSARSTERKPSVAATATDPAHGSALARERGLLDQARKSAAEGDAAAALAHVERHRQQFPAGHLAEEREAMAIRALLALGQREAARARARAFLSAYPNSLLTAVVEPVASDP